MADDKPRFYYHAHAVALSGEIKHPFQERIAEQAPSSVSPFGGYASIKADDYDLRGAVRHCGARSLTEGSYSAEKDEHYAVASASLENFNLFDVVMVEYLTAKVTAVHSVRQQEPSISPHGSNIRNLRVAGHLIELEPLCGIYHTLDTMTKVREDYRNNKSFREAFHRDANVGNGESLPEKVLKFFPWRKHKATDELPEFRDHTIVPLFRIKDPQVRGIDVYGNVMHVHNFGRIRVGEMFINRDQRRVVMLHVEMGSPQSGDLNAGTGSGGGGQTDP